MLNDEQLMEEASKKFDIPRLKKDMEEYEKITTAPWQEFLCILTGLNIKDAANKLSKTEHTIYTSLNNRGVKSALIALLNLEDDENIEWERVPRKLIDAGYGLEQDHEQLKFRSTLSSEIFKQMLEDKIKKITSDFLVNTNFDSQAIYVPLGLIERKEKPRHREVTAERGSELYRVNEYEISREFENDQFLTEVLLQGDSPKSQGRRIAIIGEPGSGKSTRLQQIAMWLMEQSAENYVIWISLADLRGYSLEDFLLKKWLKEVLKQRETSEDNQDELVKIFNQGNVWLLLDGIDEMGLSENPLAWINHQICGWLDQAKIIASCRINVWDGNRQALNQFDVYRNLDFSDDQRNEFITKFLGDHKLSEGLINELGQLGKERISDLVRNPLRLTLICRSWQKRQGKLPDTKAGLYQECIDAYYDWKEEPKTTKAQRKELNKALGELAKQALDRDDFRFRLTEAQISEVLGESDEGLFKLALNLGWLNEIGQAEENHKNIYAFFHPSFQEYFAALVIDSWTFFLNHNNNNPNPFEKYNNKDCVYRVFKPEWKEVICNWMGLENIYDNQKDELIDNLHKFQDGLNGLELFKKSSLALSLYFVSQYTKYKKINFLIDDGLNFLGDKLFSNEIQESLFLLQTDYLRLKILKLIKNCTNTKFLSKCILTNKNKYSLIARLFKGNDKLCISLVDELKFILNNKQGSVYTEDDVTDFNEPDKLSKYDICHLILELDMNDYIANIIYNQKKEEKDYKSNLQDLSMEKHDIVLNDLFSYFSLVAIGGLDPTTAQQIEKLITDAFNNKKYDNLINLIIQTNSVDDLESLDCYLIILDALLALSCQSFRFKSYSVIESNFLSLIKKTCDDYPFTKDKERHHEIFSSQFYFLYNFLNKSSHYAFNDLNNLICTLKIIYYYLKNIQAKKPASEYIFLLNNCMFSECWECLQKLSKEMRYVEFYKAWYSDSSQKNELNRQHLNLQITNQVYSLSINTENLNMETDEINLLKRLKTRLINSLPTEINHQISEFIKNKPQPSELTVNSLIYEIENIIMEIKVQSQIDDLTLFLNNSEPSQLLVNMREKFSDIVQIEWNR